MKVLTYRTLRNQEPAGGFTVSVPAGPGCITSGDPLGHALRIAKKTMEGYIEALKEPGNSIPGGNKTFEYSISILS
jgi:antitoxin HicB